MTDADKYTSSCRYCPQKEEYLKEQCVIYKTFDDVLDAVKPFGRYQIFICITVLLSSLMWAGNYAFDVFALLDPEWRCQPVNPIEMLLTNRTSGNCKDNCSGLVAVDRYFYGVVEQWHLICDRRWIVALLVTVPTAVMFVGSVFAGHFSEWYGRKTGLTAMQFGLCLSSVLTVCSRSWIALLIFRCISLFFWSCINVSLKILSMECTSTKYRIIPASSFQWAIAYMFVSLIAYLTKTWPMYLIIANVVTSPVLLGFLVFLESPRWLIQQNRLDDAGRVLSDIGSSRWNKSVLTILKEQLELIPHPNRPHKYSSIHLLSRDPPLLKVTLIQILAMLTYSFTKDAYILTAVAFAKSPFVSVAVYGGVRIWVPILLIFLDWRVPKFGRKSLFMFSLVIIIVTYTVALGVRAGNFTNLAHLEAVFVIIGTCTAASGYEISIILITFEYYPTVLRSVAMGTFYAFDYLGSLLMLALITASYHSATYLTISHGLAVAMSVATFLLGWFWQVETKNMTLKETFSDYQHHD